MLTIIQTLLFILNIIWFILIAHIVMSWLIGFQVLNMRQPIVAQLWFGLNRLLEPVYGPIRRIMPNTGGLDLSPIVLFIIVYALQRFLINIAPNFY